MIYLCGCGLSLYLVFDGVRDFEPSKRWINLHLRYGALWSRCRAAADDYFSTASVVVSVLLHGLALPLNVPGTRLVHRAGGLKHELVEVAWLLMEYVFGTWYVPW